MENKLKIGIDLDDVVFEFVRALINYYREKTGNNFLFENIISYNFSDILNIKHEEIEKLMKEMIENGKGLDMDFCAFAKESVLKLSKENDIYFITSRVYRNGTKEILNKHFSEIDFDLIFSSNPYAKNPGKHKGEICKELNIDYMIEDSYEHSINCAESGIKCFLLDKPWNQKENLHENIMRVKNWYEIMEKLEK